MGRKPNREKISAIVGVMNPLRKEKELVTRDQKHKRDVNMLGLMGISYLEARIASLIPKVFHLSSLGRATLATQANQLGVVLYHVTEEVNVSFSPYFICLF